MYAPLPAYRGVDSSRFHGTDRHWHVAVTDNGCYEAVDTDLHFGDLLQQLLTAPTRLLERDRAERSRASRLVELASASIRQSTVEFLHRELPGNWRRRPCIAN